jgi:hypothetical protein
MHSYPLKFKTEATPADFDLTVLDAEKNKILFRPKITEPVKKGQAPSIIYTDKVSNQPVYNTLFQENDGVISYLIRTPGETLLGKLVAGPGHAWQVMDENEHVLATIQEKSTWKNSCLFQLIMLPFDDDGQETILKLLAPHRYVVTLDGKKVLELREVVSTISGDYSLKKKGEFSERQEALLLTSLITALDCKE